MISTQLIHAIAVHPARRNTTAVAISSIAFVITLFCVNASFAGEDNVVHIYNWADYIGKHTLKQFQDETGIKTTYDVFDGNDILQGKLLAGHSGFDIVVPTSHIVPKLIQANVFLPLDQDKLPNRKHLDPALMSMVARFDPDHRYAIPYLWGTTGIGYNRQAVEAALGHAVESPSWSLVFDPDSMRKLSQCGVSFLDAYDELFPAVLAWLGKDPTTADSAIFEREVIPVLNAVKPYVTYYHSSKYINDLANGDICIAIGWSGDVLQSAQRAVEAGKAFEIAYGIPAEGTALWFDMLAIPVDAPNPDNAHRFINFVMDPAVITDVTNTVRYANANLSAQNLIDPLLRENPGVYPTKETSEKFYIVPTYSQAVDRKATRLWGNLKSSRQ